MSIPEPNANLVFPYSEKSLFFEIDVKTGADFKFLQVTGIKATDSNGKFIKDISPDDPSFGVQTAYVRGQPTNIPRGNNIKLNTDIPWLYYFSNETICWQLLGVDQDYSFMNGKTPPSSITTIEGMYDIVNPELESSIDPSIYRPYILTFLCKNKSKSSNPNSIVDVYYKFVLSFSGDIPDISAPLYIYLYDSKIQFTLYNATDNMKLSSAGTFFSPTSIPKTDIFLQLYPTIVNPCVFSYDTKSKQFIYKKIEPASILPIYINTIVVENLNTVRLQQPIAPNIETSCYQDFFFQLNNGTSTSKWYGESIPFSNINKLQVPNAVKWNGSAGNTNIFFPCFVSLGLWNNTISTEKWLFSSYQVNGSDPVNGFFSVTPNTITNGFNVNGRSLLTDVRQYLSLYYYVEHNDPLAIVHYPAGYIQSSYNVLITSFSSPSSITSGSFNGFQRYPDNITDEIQRKTGYFGSYQTALSLSQPSKIFDLVPVGISEDELFNHRIAGLSTYDGDRGNCTLDKLTAFDVIPRLINNNSQIQIEYKRNGPPLVTNSSVWSTFLLVISPDSNYPVFASSGVLLIYFINSFWASPYQTNLNIYSNGSIIELQQSGYMPSGDPPTYEPNSLPCDKQVAILDNQNTDYIQPLFTTSDDRFQISQKSMSTYSIASNQNCDPLVILTFTIPTSTVPPLTLYVFTKPFYGTLQNLATSQVVSTVANEKHAPSMQSGTELFSLNSFLQFFPYFANPYFQLSIQGTYTFPDAYIAYQTGGEPFSWTPSMQSITLYNIWNAFLLNPIPFSGTVQIKVQVPFRNGYPFSEQYLSTTLGECGDWTPCMYPSQLSYQNQMTFYSLFKIILYWEPYQKYLTSIPNRGRSPSLQNDSKYRWLLVIPSINPTFSTSSNDTNAIFLSLDKDHYLNACISPVSNEPAPFSPSMQSYQTNIYQWSLQNKGESTSGRIEAGSDYEVYIQAGNLGEFPQQYMTAGNSSYPEMSVKKPEGTWKMTAENYR